MQKPHLYHLIQLLDDDNPVVREAITQELNKRRYSLHEELLASGIALNEVQELQLRELFSAHCREELEQRWEELHTIHDFYEYIEQALSLLSTYLNGWSGHPDILPQRLNQLAQNVRKHFGHTPISERRLAEYLFATRNHAPLKGNIKDFYASHNSDPLWVLDNGLGNPISLCCIYLLVGKRLGLTIQGCNFPGHFLARVEEEDQVWLVDCFNRGRFMLAEDIAKYHPAANPALEEVIEEPASAKSILRRILRNINEAFDREKNVQKQQILRRLYMRMNTNDDATEFS